jgi:LPS-assembly protein
LGFLDRRQGILGTAMLKLDANWVLRGSVLYDLRANNFSQNMISIGYIDDCLILGLNYITNYSYGSGTPVLNHTVMLQLSLRTLGGTTVSQSVGGTNGSGAQNGQ